MTYVITEPCVNVKDASCVDVCPVDCIHPMQSEDEFESVNMLYINPDECIDCGACEPACPVNAIFEESAVPEQWRQYIKINADFYKKSSK
ncbi:MAG TPA: ferredoxin family protein [Ktedonobacterales bacterium]|jgi:NAD-dependent dihydropyrimidine dehydrogenase PreA subunit